MKIAVLVSFLMVLGVFIFATQIPITLTEDEVAKAIGEASSESESPVDEDLLAQAVQLSVSKLEKAQSTRLKYLASAYFVIVILVSLHSICIALGETAARTRQTPRTIGTGFRA